MAKSFKKVALRAPFVTMKTGLVVQGIVDRKRAEVKGKFGAKPVVVLRLTEDLKQEAKGKDGKMKPVTYKAGEAVQFDVKPGIVALMDLDEGTEVRITVTGQVDTGKGNPAWSFELETAE